MVDVITSSVAAYQADALTQTRANGFNVQASHWNQIINDLRSLNEALQGDSQITALDVAGTLDVDGAVSLNATGAALSLTASSAFVRGQKGASENNAPFQFFTDHGSGLRLTWAFHNRSDERFWIARYNSSGSYQGSPINIDNATGDIRIETLIEYGSGGPTDRAGSGTPEGVVTAPVGSTYRRTDGGASTSFYVKESGTGNTGWVAK